MSSCIRSFYATFPSSFDFGALVTRRVCSRIRSAEYHAASRATYHAATSSIRIRRVRPAPTASRLESAVLCDARSLASTAAPTSLFGDTVIITKRCAERLKELRESKAQPDLRLRLAVEGGGCSGFQYKFALEDPAQRESDESVDAEEDSDDEEDGEVDHEYERDGAVLIIDDTSLEFVRGATVDFEEDMMRSAFAVVNNPISESACGCGSSFAIKNFETNPAID